MSMIGNRPPAIVLILAMAASPVLAETYKWVDAKGVVTYSDSPPPSTAAKPKVVEERISVIPPDPALGPAVAAMQARAERRTQYEEADYLLRQRYMLEAQANYAATACPYGSICDAGYASSYYPYAYGGLGYRAGAGRRYPPQVSPYRSYWDYPVYPAAYRPGGGASFQTGAGAPSGRGAVSAGRGSFR
jgi:hypothetical protein